MFVTAYYVVIFGQCTVLGALSCGYNVKDTTEWQNYCSNNFLLNSNCCMGLQFHFGTWSQHLSLDL
jgi:hypothetical protein